MRWIFLLTVWAEQPPQVAVQADNLTGAECMALVEAYNAANPRWTAGIPSCEIDLGV